MKGRPKLSIKRTVVSFTIADEILSKYEMLVYDPVANRAKWGVKSRIVELLLQKFFNAHINGETTIDIRACSHLLRK